MLEAYSSERYVYRGSRVVHAHIQVIGVDPYGSILAEPPELNKTDVTFFHVRIIFLAGLTLYCMTM